MSKLKGDGSVYILRGLPGPVKIGLTVTNLKRRQAAAAREIGCPVEIIGRWSSSRAWLVEKFAHIYLQDFYLFGEWFDVSAVEQLRAANQVFKQERARPLATLRDLKADVIRRCEGALHV